MLFFIKLIKTYQAKSNPNKHRCRYYPSCSTYGLISYERHNIIKASFLTLFRILRCNPLFKGGYDPVPLSKIEKQISLLTKNKL